MAEQRKARIATASLAGCFGCHMAILDIDERLIELVGVDRSLVVGALSQTPYFLEVLRSTDDAVFRSVK